MAARYFCFRCRAYIDAISPGSFTCPRCGTGFVHQVNFLENISNVRGSNSMNDQTVVEEHLQPLYLPNIAAHTTAAPMSPLDMLLNRFTQSFNRHAGTDQQIRPSASQLSQQLEPIGFSVQLVPIAPNSNDNDTTTPSADINIQVDTTNRQPASPGSNANAGTIQPAHPGMHEFFFRINRDSNNRSHLNVNLSPNLLRAVLESDTTTTQQALNRSVNELIALFGGLISGSMDGSSPPMSHSDVQDIPTKTVTQQMIDESKACSICLDLFVQNDTYKELPCHHQYHVACIDRWLLIHGNCPICRTGLNTERTIGDLSEPD